MLAPWKESHDKHSVLKSRDITLMTKVCIVTTMVFSVVMYRCESWTIKKAEHRTEETLESTLESKEIKPVNPKGNQPWIFTGRTDDEAEAPIFGHLMWRADSLEKTLESPLESKEIKPVSPKGNQPWIVIGRIDAKAETLNTLATWCKESAH